VGSARTAVRDGLSAHRQGTLERLVMTREGWLDLEPWRYPPNTLSQRRNPPGKPREEPKPIEGRSVTEGERGLASHPIRYRRGARAENSGHGEQRRLPSIGG